MADSLLFAFTQLNPIVGDIPGNLAKLTVEWGKARERGADLVITPELFLTGYPPEDFSLKSRHHKVIREAIDALARATASGPSILIGTPWVEEGGLFNAALLLEGGQIAHRSFKHDLPNYGPFDEKRVYQSAAMPDVILWREHRLGVLLCEDMWKPDVARHLAAQDAALFLVMNGSPYEAGKQQTRLSLAQARVKETGVPLVYVNQVGGQDELLFEGASFALDECATVVTQAQSWVEETLFIRTEAKGRRLVPQKGNIAPAQDDVALTYQGLTVGIRDFVTKNKFSRVLLGLSGGIDSALVAALAVDALGADKVRAVMMPSPYTTQESLEDAALVAKNLGCRLDTIPITQAMQVFDHALAEQFIGCAPDVTEENIQARARGIILMALSNKSGAMVLATGNKSEMAVGYATLYGDMCGGYAPLKDVYKTNVYKLARWRNENRGAVIPQRVFEKAPTAELREGQKDQDSLPSYEILDKILNCLVEQDLGVAETIMTGQDSATIRRVCVMLDGAEYKRRQSPPGPKVTCRHLRLDRRYPITNRYADRWRLTETD